jgi:hypothetical protein
MAQFYNTGPIPIWVGVGPDAAANIDGASGDPLFLGHCEKKPRISIRPAYSKVFVDLGGQEIPGDYLFQGAEAFVYCDITRFNEDTYAILADYAALQERGHTDPGEIGSLMVTENSAFPLWLPFPYSAKAAMNDMPQGYHFFNAFLENDDLNGLGTAPREQGLVFHCVRELDVTFQNDFGAGQWKLYDNDCSAVFNLQID